MSVEYIFFNEELRDRFTAFVSARGVPSQMRKDEVEGFVVRVPEEIDEAVSDAIEDEYDVLMQEQILLAETDESWATRQIMGVEIKLADGTPCMVRIDGPIGRRLSEHFSPEEIRELVDSIAKSVENPIEGPLCRKV